jgi:dipeptidyl aminopeptidase/acylaminoacyl peptidase
MSAGSGPAPFSAVERLLSVGRAFLPRPTPSGLIFGCDLSGVAGVFELAGPRSFPRRLIAGSERVLPVAHTRHGLLVRFDRSGDETWRLALLGPDGRLRILTPDGSSHRGASVAPGGDSVGIVTNRSGDAQWAIADLHLGTGELSTWPIEPGQWSWLAWRPDGAAAVLARRRHSLLNEAYVMSRDGARHPLLPQSRLVASVAWTADHLVAVTDLGDDFLRLVEVEPDPPYRVRRVLHRSDGDVYAMAADPGGRRVLFAVNEGPGDGLFVADLATGGVRRLPMPTGLLYDDGATEGPDHIAWDADGNSVFVSWESATQPAEIIQVWPSGATAPVRWTDAGSGLPSGLVEPEPVSYPAFDGLRIPALHYRLPGRPRPTVVYFHGGPEGQSRAGLNPAVAVWTMAGYDVLAPNIRGSTGYGHRYASLDDRELRPDSVRDACAAAHWLRACDGTAALVAAGRSYGGFLTLAVLVEEPDLWSAGVDIVGISDWHSFFRGTNPARRALRIVEYGDPDGAEARLLADLSPLHRADRITAPLFIVHGRHDARVPVREAEMIHAAVPHSELLILEDEGHSISKRANLVRAYHGAVAFVNRRLGPPTHSSLTRDDPPEPGS